MASIEVLNTTQANVEAPVEIQLSLGNPIYRGPEGRPGRDGVVGRDGKSAYEIAVENGFEGNVEAWLASLHGANGSNGQDGAPGVDGNDGQDGKSAYEIAVDNGFVGTEVQWLASLQGATGQTGQTGATGPQGPKGDTPIKGTDYFTSQDIADFIAQVPEEVDVYYIQAWLKTRGDTTDNDYIDLRTISASDKTTLETIYANFKNNQNSKIVLIWLGANGGVNPLHDYILTNNTALCICRYNRYGQCIDIEPICWGDKILQYNPARLHYNNNDELITTQLLFAPVFYNGDYVSVNNPINNQSAQALNNVLSSMNSTYATKAEVETAIRGAESGLLKRSVVQALPVSEIDDNTIYMVPKTGSTGDVYDEYLYVNNVWEHIGSTDIDLTGYATTSYVNSALEGISLKRPLRIITVYTYAVVSQTYDSVNMATVYELMTNGSKLFPTQEDLDWCNNYLNYGFNEYPFMFQIKYADSSNYVNNQTLLLYPYTGLIRYANWDNVKDFRGMFQIIGAYGSGYIYIDYSTWSNNSASFSGSSNYRLQWVLASSGYGPADISWSTYKWLTDRIAAISSLPAQPSNDGDYLLKCSVSSGTAAYAWENVVVGGSY